MSWWIPLSDKFIDEGAIRLPPVALRLLLFILMKVAFRAARDLQQNQLMLRYRDVQHICADEGNPPVAVSTLIQSLRLLESRGYVRGERRPGRPSIVTLLRCDLYGGPRNEQTASAGTKGTGSSRTTPPIVHALGVKSETQRVETLCGPGRQNKNEDDEDEGPNLQALSSVFFRLTNARPTAADLAQMRGALDAAAEVSPDPVRLVESAMEAAITHYKPTALSPTPRSMRWFVGWVQRAIDDAVRHCSSKEERRNVKPAKQRNKQLDSGETGGYSRWVKPEHQPRDYSRE